MSKRPYLTVLLCHDREVVRADFASRSTDPVFVLSKQKADTDDWQTAVEIALAPDRSLGRRVCIFVPQLPVHILSFPSDTVAHMSTEELDNAFKFEIETLAGIDVDDVLLASQPAHSPSNDYKSYWVTVVRKQDFQAIANRLGKLGVRSLEMAHPAGIASGMLGGSAANAGKPVLEVWDHSTFHFSPHDNRLAKIGRTPGDLENADGATTFFSFPPPASVESSDTDQVNHDATLRHNWLAESARRLSVGGQRMIPVIVPHRRRQRLDLRPVVSVLLAVLALAGCVWHRTWIETKTVELSRQIEVLGQPAEAKKRFDGEQRKLLEQQQVLEKEYASGTSELHRIKFFFENQVDRLPRLMNLLAELRSPELVVQEFRPELNGMALVGISLNGDSAPLFANRLRLLAAPLGWKVSAATQEGEEKLVSGGPWSFQILLEDIGPGELSANTGDVNAVARWPQPSETTRRLP